MFSDESNEFVTPILLLPIRRLSPEPETESFSRASRTDPGDESAQTIRHVAELPMFRFG